ncbi:unnamed protein product, partial [marine sediment metagenome]
MIAKRSLVCVIALFLSTVFSSDLNARRKKLKATIAETSEVKQEEPMIVCTSTRKSRKAKKVEMAKQNPSQRTWSLFSKKTLSSMNFEELKQSKDEQLATNNKDGAIKFLEKMIPQCTDMRELEKIMIELGDLYYETERLTKAYTMYREFVNMYPGSQKVEYALYRAIVCKFDGINDAERDQTPTKETLALAEEFLERSDVFTTHIDDVKTIRKQCRDRLFDNVESIFNFYLNNKRVISASQRITTIKKEFGTKDEEENLLEVAFEPRIINLEIEFAQAINNNELLAQNKR